MAMKIKTISILFGKTAVDVASFTLANVERVNGQWHEEDEKSQPCHVDGNTVSLNFNDREYIFTFDLNRILEEAKKLASTKLKWTKQEGEVTTWYVYAQEENRIEVPCSVKEGFWSLKIGFKTNIDPSIVSKKKVTGLLNFRRCEPMTIEF